jgi:hypothetical protein
VFQPRARPLALLVDDAQWADEPSLAFLGFLARRLDELPVMVVLSLRPVDLGAPEALLSLRADSGARLLAPRGLSTKGIERMLAEQIGGEVEEGFALACQDATGGNPFLLGELVLELKESGVVPLAVNAPEIDSLAPRRAALRTGCWRGWDASHRRRQNWRMPWRCSATAQASARRLRSLDSTSERDRGDGGDADRRAV